MKSERMFEIIGDLDDKYVAEASPDREVSEKASRRRRWVKIGAGIAAALVAAVTIFAMSDVGAQLFFFGDKVIVYNAMNDCNTLNYPKSEYPDKIEVTLPWKTVTAYKCEEPHAGEVSYEDDMGNIYNYVNNVLQSGRMKEYSRDDPPGEDHVSITEDEALRIGSEFLTVMYGNVAEQGEFEVNERFEGFSVTSFRYAGKWRIGEIVHVNVHYDGNIEGWFVGPRLDAIDVEKAAKVTLEQLEEYCREHIDPRCVINTQYEIPVSVALDGEGETCFQVAYEINRIESTVRIPLSELVN